MGNQALQEANRGEALLVCEDRDGPIHPMLTDAVMPVVSRRQPERRLTSIHLGMKVVYMSGSTYDTIMYHGRLESGIGIHVKVFHAGYTGATYQGGIRCVPLDRIT